MKIDEMKKVCEDAIGGPCAATARHIATFNPELVKKLLAVVVAATEMRRPVPPEITAAFAIQTWLDGLERALDNALAALEE